MRTCAQWVLWNKLSRSEYMRHELDEIIKNTSVLHETLDKIVNNPKLHNMPNMHVLDSWNWEIYKLLNHAKSLKEWEV